MVEPVAHRIALAGEQGCKFVERCDLGRASAGKLLAHRGALVAGGRGLQLRQHALAVGFGRRVGVDVEHVQPRHAGHGHRLVGQRHAQHFVQVGGRIGADQQYFPPSIRQGNGRGGGQRGFAHPALAGEEQKTRGLGEQAQGDGAGVWSGHASSMA